MKSIKIYAFLLILSTGGMAYSMPAPYGDKEKAEEYVRDRQGTTKAQGQGTTSDNSGSNQNGTHRDRN